MKIENRDIYEQIGNLFYAIADGQHVKPLEIAELKLLISKDWLPREDKKQSAVSAETHSILTTMDVNEGDRLTGAEAFREFSKFYRINASLFTGELRQRILTTAVEITNIFKSERPGENVHLLALKELLGTADVQKV